jgi:molybdopterin-containing oxidoreductase family membrane subunit
MIGSVFGLTESRVTYFGPVMSVYCLLMALLSGTALCLLYNLALERLRTAPASPARGAIHDDLARILTFTLGTVIVFTLLKVTIESATVIPEFLNYRQYAQIFGGIGRINNEVILGLLLPFVLLAIPSLRALPATRLVASGLVLAGMLAMHMEILLAGQSHPIGPKAEQFRSMAHYVPSFYEWMILLLSLAVALMLYTLGERYLRLEAAPGP